MNRELYDKNGNLRPMMLSELKQLIDKAMDEHGDMIVWLEVDYFSGDHTLTEGGPAEMVSVMKPEKVDKGTSYWPDDKRPVFLIHR